MNDLAYGPRRPLDGPHGPAAAAAAGRRLLDAAPHAGHLALLIAAATAAADLSTAAMNLSIVYALPMALWARSARPAAIWRAAAALVLLSYAGYFLGPWPADCPTWHAMLFHYRVTNRLVACTAVVSIAAMSHFGIVLRRRIDGRWEPRNVRESDREIFEEVVASFEQFQAAAMAAVAVLGVAVVDVLAPAQYNPSTLYAVPVLACVRTRSRLFLWTTVAVAVALIYAGYAFGPAPRVPAEFIPRIQRNRRISAAMVAMVGLFVHIWIGIDHPRRRRRPTPPTDPQPERA